MTDADDADGQELLANTPVQAKYQLHTLEQAAGDTGLYVNVNETEFNCFKGEFANWKGPDIRIVLKKTWGQRMGKNWYRIIKKGCTDIKRWKYNFLEWSVVYVTFIFESAWCFWELGIKILPSSSITKNVNYVKPY